MLCRQFRVVIDRALHRQTTMCQPMHTLGFLIVMADVVVPVVARGAWFGHHENVAACACGPNGERKWPWSTHRLLPMRSLAIRRTSWTGTGAGGTCSGRDTELPIGGALAAAGAVAGAYQHRRTTVSDRVTEDIGHID